jgi:hypothetical protein
MEPCQSVELYRTQQDSCIEGLIFIKILVLLYLNTSPAPHIVFHAPTVMYAAVFSSVGGSGPFLTRFVSAKLDKSSKGNVCKQ